MASPLVSITVEDDAPVRPSLVAPAVLILIPFAIGFAIAEGIHRGTGFDDYSSVIEADLKPRRLYWLYLSALLCAWLTRWLNSFPTAFKNAAMEAQGTAAKGNIRANM